MPGHVTLETSPAAEDLDQDQTTLRHAARRVAGWIEENPDQTIGVLVRKNKAGWSGEAYCKGAGLPVSLIADADRDRS